MADGSGKGSVIVGIVVTALFSSTAPFWWPKTDVSASRHPTLAPTEGTNNTHTPPPPVLRPMGAGEAGVELMGGDYAQTKAPMGEACSKICQDDSRCVAMTFRQSTQQCFLKNTITGQAKQHDPNVPDYISTRRLR
jgi:hypothetical protein